MDTTANTIRASVMFAAIAATATGPAVAQQLPVRGVVRPIQQAVISTDLFARISRLPLKQGESFAVGDLLVEFDCAAYSARLKAATAEHKSKALEFQNQKVLASHNAVGRYEVAIAETKVAEAAAKVEEMESHLDQCIVKAPFAGHIANRHVNRYEMPKAGSPLLELIDDSTFEIELIVPSDWLGWLQPATGFSFEVEETGSVLQASINRFGATVDPVSQTVTVFGVIENAPVNIKAGMSGTARFARPEG